MKYNIIEHMINDMIVGKEVGAIGPYSVIIPDGEIPANATLSFDPVLKVFKVVASETVNSNTLTNTTPTPSAIGGIPAGTTFNNSTLTSILMQLLYPYQYPAFTASANPTVFEVGANSGDITVTFTISNSSNVAGDTSLYLDGTLLEISISSPHTLGGQSLLTPGNKTIKLECVNTKGEKFYKNITLSWQPRVHYGESINESLTADEIQSLRGSLLSTTYKRTINFIETPGYKYYIYPSYMGVVSKFKDTSTNMEVAMSEPIEINITNALGVTLTYICYRSLNILNGSITIEIS